MANVLMLVAIWAGLRVRGQSWADLGLSQRGGGDLFVKAGLKPYDALRAATVTAARVLGRLERLATVAVGKDADLLLLDQNPLENLASLRRPLGVMVRGRFSDRADLEALARESR